MNSFLEFLLSLITGSKPLGLSALNTARSAISSMAFVNGQPIGQHPLTSRFMRAAFNVRPSLPKTLVTWDVNVVLCYLRTLSPGCSIPMIDLTKKLVLLLLLLSGQRGQTITLLDTRNMTLTKSSVTFRVGDPIKTTRPNRHIEELRFRAYAPDRRLCIVTALSHYLKRTAAIRPSTVLILTTKYPFQPASRDTIRRWTKDLLTSAGIDMSIFSPHSTRAAATSKAACHVPLQTILKTAGWANPSTFVKYYQKDIVLKPCHAFDAAVLRGVPSE